MKIIVDESVSFGVVRYLRDKGYDVTAIAEGKTAGLKDSELYNSVKKYKAVLITRDHHFTNSLRFPPQDTACIVFIRKGNLTSREEVELIKWLIRNHSFEDFSGKLVSLYKKHIKIR
ncbi:DUF5615 family PIN-like protein [bacterium]|nr:DUF5615 family PIN-like protein [bacterium]